MERFENRRPEQERRPRSEAVERKEHYNVAEAELYAWYSNRQRNQRFEIACNEGDTGQKAIQRDALSARRG